MKPQEIEAAEKNTGKRPEEFTVGYDALAVYVHRDNPLDEIELSRLGEIYVEGGTLTRWSQIGVTIPGVSDDTIVRISRQSSSGTYEFFRDHVLDQRDFQLGSRDLNGSKGSRGAGEHDPHGHRLQRHGLRDGPREDAAAQDRAR